ncbi:RNA-directed DNA polymerase, eukaryota [Tanacetum coccineum]
MDVKFLWGNSNYQFVFSESVGNSGGILCVWEANVFHKDFVSVSDNFIALYGTWIPTKSKVLMIVIYAPQSPALKRVLWDYISSLISRWNGETVIMGDFNEVRSVDERLGSTFNHSSARVFNNFISSSGLVEVKMEGYSFTWSLSSGKKMSKLDRFLVSEGILLLFPSITAICLDRHLSDHRPIILNEIRTDYGPVPFRTYHSWFLIAGFDTMVENAWNSFSHSDSNSLIRFKKKLQDLKKIIRTWIKDKKSHHNGVLNTIKEDLIRIDKNLDSGVCSDETLSNRRDLMHRLHVLKQLEVNEATYFYRFLSPAKRNESKLPPFPDSSRPFIPRPRLYLLTRTNMKLKPLPDQPVSQNTFSLTKKTSYTLYRLLTPAERTKFRTNQIQSHLL